MFSFLWLLLYLAPLLGLTAALFAWFGWQWRGSDLQQRILELSLDLEAARKDGQEHVETESEKASSEAASAAAEPAATAQAVEKPAEVKAEPSHDARAEELNALRAGLRDAESAAQAAAILREDEKAKANEARLALETEAARLLDALDQLRADHAAAVAELALLRSAAPLVDTPAEAPADESSLPAKSKRKRSAPAKPKAPAAATATLREITSTLEGQLAAYQSSLSALTQERDDWQRRIAKLEDKAPPDPAGLGLARRSFADSEKRLATAQAEIERLQNQTRVLHRVEAQAEALGGVPDDDLTQIKGIKKVISEQLRAHGIRTWRQIAQWNDDEQRAFSELLAFKNRATREQWQEQARALHDAAHGPSA
ncbi:hypothetical protein [Prosthecobacter sp.]|uniref:hypothetical protein n=1 Tax=Prosthecobacter sp. TaxID=1965333 RepID=UPI0037830DCD